MVYTEHMNTIVICSSANFYRQAVDLQDKLQDMGYKVIVPITATRMKASGDFNVEHYKTWFADAADYHKKASLMRQHFDEISEGDAILVLNYEKRGKQNYIGGNVLMEMCLAFYQHKPIFIMNDMPEDSAFAEEILGMHPTFLRGKIEDLAAHYDEAVETAKKH